MNARYAAEEQENQEDGGENPYAEIQDFDGADSETSEAGLPAWKQDGNETTELVAVLQKVFGLPSFRPGQRECIEQVMDGESTILLLPTGSGKSLCFQLPAYLLAKEGKMTILISPTISLMEDQLKSLNPAIRGSMLNSNQSAKETKRVLESLKNAEIDLLIISPEKAVTRSFIALMNAPNAPKIGLVCIDEAHCLSEWSHNFRPSYLHLVPFLRKYLKATCFLALTATAAPLTLKSMCSTLDINPENVVRPVSFQRQFQLTVSKPEKKFQAALDLMTTEFADCSSVIIYCMKQKETETLAATLKNANVDAAPYHGGLERNIRNSTQKRFMSGQLRIICATLAFGLGIDKPDIRAVIHFSMPKSIENYMQEIGRSGRDGKGSRCHLFLDEEDYFRLRSFAYTDAIDAVIAKKFCEKLFCETAAEIATFDTGDDLFNFDSARCLEIAPLEHELDARRSVICTMAYHACAMTHVDLLPNVFLHYKISLRTANASEGVVSDSFLKSLSSVWKVEGSVRYFETTDACAKLKISPYELHEKLYLLSHIYEYTLTPERESLAFGFSKKSKSSADAVMKTWREVAKIMDKILSENARKVDVTFGIFSNAIKASEAPFEEIDEYFMDEHYASKQPENDLVQSTVNRLKTAIRQDMRNFVAEYESQVSSGTCIARILHGISSPKFPYEEWGRVRFWSKYHKFDFVTCVKFASQALVEYMTASEK